MQHATHQAQLARLNRIHGQVAGVVRMVEQEKYCLDVLTQLRAIRVAVQRVEEQVLRAHVEQCVDAAVRSGSEREVDRKLDELFDLLAKFSK